MTTSYTPSAARANLFGIIRDVNSAREPVRITPTNGRPGAVVIAADDWDAVQETLYLEATGTMAVVRAREVDGSGVIDAATIDWDAL
ncbi:MAG: type II toxin-antitoxin system prevent-host-death family antitoxin [Bifidobacteriaceae bacterium]|jgi:prevent-host-death family protein|nr:type II toxin-antitoxin system prevent-host-death family antitoxin [Bifidobacteriaceae bacterium]